MRAVVMADEQMRARSLLRHESQIFTGSKNIIELFLLLHFSTSSIIPLSLVLDEQISENPPNSGGGRLSLSLSLSGCRVALSL